MAVRKTFVYGYPEPTPIPGKRFIEVGDKNFAIVDESNYDQLKIHTWSLDCRSEPVTRIRIDELNLITVRMKNMILNKNPSKGYCVKYLNGNPLDNSRKNIKLMTLKQARELDRQMFGPRICKKKEYKKFIRKILAR